MLEWPGPQNRKRTEYMELSEFRRRSVLPTPLPVLPRRGITRVRVRNYKSLADIEVRLGKLTILVGRNGTGKSNFIDVLRFVSEGIRDMNKAIGHEKRGGIDGIRRRSPDQLSPTISITINVEDEQFEGEYEIEIASDEKGLNELGLGKNGYYISRERCLVQAESGFEDYFIEKGILARSLPELEHAQIKATELHLSLLSRKPPFDRLYTILSELGFYSIDPDLLREPKPISTNRMLNEKGENLGSVLRSMQTNKSEWLDEIRWVLGEVVEGIANVQAEERGGYSFIEFEHDWIDKPFEAGRESEGTLRLLGLLVAMYQDQIPWLAAIEEPEKAIHPGVLALLHGAMQTTSEARSQLIITTHSPDLIANASANDLRVVEMENGSTQIDPIEEAQREMIYKKLFGPGEMMRMGGFRRAR
jgi:predicted ATPase